MGLFTPENVSLGISRGHGTLITVRCTPRFRHKLDGVVAVGPAPFAHPHLDGLNQISKKANKQETRVTGRQRTRVTKQKQLRAGTDSVSRFFVHFSLSICTLSEP